LGTDGLCFYLGQVGEARGLGSGSLGEASSITGLHIVGQVILGHTRSWQVKGQLPNIHKSQRALLDCFLGGALHIRLACICSWQLQCNTFCVGTTATTSLNAVAF